MSRSLPNAAVVVAVLVAAPAAHAGDQPWRLVGAYDASAVRALETLIPSTFTWSPAPELSTYCGHPRAPTGLGVMEAVAISTGLTPTLALVLRSETARRPPTLTETDVAISVSRLGAQSDDVEPLQLRPAVEARRLRVKLEAEDVAQRHVEVVRTQLAIELCLEHKLGRPWAGGDRTRVRQAFLLEGLGAGVADDRRYLVGQRDPVAAYLGPPDACLIDGTSAPRTTGEAASELVPADVWDGRLRPCSSLPTPPSLPLMVSGTDVRPPRGGGRWQDLTVTLEPGSGASPKVTVTLNDDVVSTLDQVALFPGSDTSNDSMEDLLGPVPLTYPMIAHQGVWYTVLLIPDWQLAEALGRATRPETDGDMGVPLAKRPPSDTNAVSWILRHPELLRVQVRPETATEDPEPTEWPDLSAAMQHGSLKMRNWGYTVGMAAGRAPILLPTVESVSWEQAMQAQRARQQSAMMVGIATLLLAFLAGLRRMGDLWRPVPEERADYWPATGKEAAAEATPDQPGGMISTEGVE